MGEDGRKVGRAGVALGVAWVLVAATAMVWGVTRTSSDLERRADQALRQAGIFADVDVEGRDATVAAAAAERDRALEVVAAVRGVRRVEAAVPGAAPSASSTTADPAQAAPASATSTTIPTTATTTTTMAPVTSTTTAPATTTTTTAAPAPLVSTLAADLHDGQLVVSGALPVAEAVGGVGLVADIVYAPFVDNTLAVDPELPPASWLAGAARAVAVLPIVGEASLLVEGESATLRARAPTPEKAAQLQGAVQAALGENVALTVDVEITGLVPPLFTVDAPGDGTVTLGGVMPDQAAVDRIVAAAVEVFGADAVTNEMVVGTGVDTTFSLFRIPLTFAQFAPMPQWRYRIENDVITGNVRGGATFEFGSAALTPELERLLDIAAGILLRNPTILITIEGHTDSVGSRQFNQGLSEARARSAVEYLVGKGVDPGRLFALGYGEDRPIADNDTDEGRARNRRVEFVLGPPGTQGEG